MTDERGAESLAAALSASAAVDRTAAAGALRARAETDPRAVASVVTELDAGLTDVDGEVRAAVSATLADVADADPAAVSTLATHLADRLEDQRADVRQYATYALARVGATDPVAVEPAFPGLVETLFADDDPLRHLGVHALAAVADADPTVLADELDESTTESGHSTTSDESTSEASDDSSSEGAVDATRLREGLQAALSETDPVVRRRASQTLARLVEAGTAVAPDPAAVLAVLDDETAATRRNAAFLLARVADEDPATVVEADAVTPLCDRLDDHDAVVVHATAALGDAGRVAPEALTPVADRLFELTTHQRADVRANTVLAVGRLAGVAPERVGDTVEELAELLGDDAPVVRANTAFALAELAAAEPDAARPAMEALLDRLEDESEADSVRNHAGTALDTLRSELSPGPSPVPADDADDGIPRGAAAVTEGRRGVGSLDESEGRDDDTTELDEENRDSTGGRGRAGSPTDITPDE
jgi:vesicle coat complex subunit